MSDFRKNAKWVRLNGDVYRNAEVFLNARGAVPITDDEALQHFLAIGHPNIAALGLETADPKLVAEVLEHEEKKKTRGRKKAEVVVGDDPEAVVAAVDTQGVPEE